MDIAKARDEFSVFCANNLCNSRQVSNKDDFCPLSDFKRVPKELDGDKALHITIRDRINLECEKEFIRRMRNDER